LLAKGLASEFGRDAMLSPRRTAQLCLAAATLTLVTTITVLVAGSSDENNNSAVARQPAAQVTPLATGQLDTLQSVASSKR
jgi:hypothetical protein